MILIVDRDFDSRRIYRAVLEWGGYAVVEATDAHEVVDLAQAHSPELIIGDFPLGLGRGEPPLTEAALLGALRPSRPRIMRITARQFLDESSVDRSACDAIFLKPVEPTRMLDAVQRLLGH